MTRYVRAESPEAAVAAAREWDAQLVDIDPEPISIEERWRIGGDKKLPPQGGLSGPRRERGG